MTVEDSLIFKVIQGLTGGALLYLFRRIKALETKNEELLESNKDLYQYAADHEAEARLAKDKITNCPRREECGWHPEFPQPPHHGPPFSIPLPSNQP